MGWSERGGRGTIGRGRPTPTVENYLKAIQKQRDPEGWIPPRALARYLGVSGASVTSMLRRLRREGLAAYAPYRGARLTEKGEAEALRVIRRHRILERFLTDLVGVPWDEVDEEAEALEHALSERLERRIDRLLSHPRFDPHGDPIPRPAGRPAARTVLEGVSHVTLAEAPEGRAVVVRGVSDHDAARLRYLSRIGISPDVRLEVRRRRTAEGPIEVRIGGRTRRIERRAAGAVFVAPAG